MPELFGVKASYNEIMLIQIRLNHWLLPIMLAAAILQEFLDPARVWKILLIGLGGTLLVGWVWSLSLARHLRLLRELRYGWAQVGDALEERLTLTNQASFPATWVEIEDHSTLPGYRASLATITDSHSVNTLTTGGVCQRRGLYLLGGTRLLTGDPLGIFTVTMDDPASRTLLVLPPVIPLPQILLTPGGYLGEGRPRERAREETVHAISIREYRPGDALRHIHWPSTAKFDRLITRQFESHPASDRWILLDLNQHVQAGTGADSTTEHAIILSASLIDRELRNRQAVGLAINGAPPRWLPASRNEPQRWQLLHALALAEPGMCSLKDFLLHGSQSLGRHASLVIISASTETDWLQALAALLWRGISPTVLLLDAASFGKSGSSLPLCQELQRLGIACQIIPRDLLDRPEAHPGHSGRWEWQQSRITGKVTTLQRPEQTEWHRLT